jgi:hypothetical protein
MDSFGCWAEDGIGTPLGGASETWSTSPARCARSTESCPWPSEADCIGEGGGCGLSERAFARAAEASTVGVCADEDDPRRDRWPADLALTADLVDAASDLSIPPLLGLVSMLSPEVEFLGLSVFPLPGILDLMELRKDREDSFVSDLLNEG